MGQQEVVVNVSMKGKLVADDNGVRLVFPEPTPVFVSGPAHSVDPTHGVILDASVMPIDLSRYRENMEDMIYGLTTND